ncbi:hypothetical protein ACTXT7_009521 [Hymenolepis weldensis]
MAPKAMVSYLDYIFIPHVSRPLPILKPRTFLSAVSDNNGTRIFMRWWRSRFPSPGENEESSSSGKVSMQFTTGVDED